jgi:hypothetical protein
MPKPILQAVDFFIEQKDAIFPSANQTQLRKVAIGRESMYSAGGNISVLVLNLICSKGHETACDLDMQAMKQFSEQ